MSAIENVRAAMMEAASNPSIGGGVSATAIVAGTMAVITQVTTILGFVSIVVGIIAGIFVIRVNHLKHKLMKREWDSGASKYGDAD